MAKIWAIAWKELYTTLRDRNLLLIMFATPLLLSTIIGLAFGGLGSDGGSSPIQEIPIAVVNLDAGFDLQQNDLISSTDPLDLSTISFTVGGQTLNLGEQLQQNQSISATLGQSLTTQLGGAIGFDFNYGELLANILLAKEISATSVFSGNSVNGTGGLDFGALDCPLINSPETSSTFSGTLNELFAAQPISDATAARAGVDSGRYVAAVIIQPDFSQQLMPGFASTLTISDSEYVSSTVELYANSGRPISVSIVRSVVEGIVNQLARTKVAVSAILNGAGDTLLSGIDFTQANATEVSGLLQGFTLSQTVAPLTCLFQPSAGNLTLKQQPLDPLQEVNRFAFIVTQIGSAQAVFFSLFTGVFGLLAIYEERKQWTLQRMLVSPTPRRTILLGMLLGNLVVIIAQLLLLLLALTVITSIVTGTVTFVWGSNLPLLLLVIVALALSVSGVGVLIIGLARSPEQVRLIAPMVNIGLGVLGGTFAVNLPENFSRLSLIYWGVDAFNKLASGQSDIGPNLLVLFALGIGLFGVGSWLFKRRVGL